MGDLSWPPQFERTDPHRREPYPGGFRVTRSVAFKNILSELGKWNGVTDVQLDSGAPHTKQNPNRPYANATFDDPGVVVRFNKDGQDMAAACDRWDNPRDNAQDLYHYLHETRMQEQRGTVTAQSEYEKLRLPSGTGDYTHVPDHEVLGVSQDADADEVKAAFRAIAQKHHPDAGDEPDADKLTAARKAKERMLS